MVSVTPVSLQRSTQSNQEQSNQAQQLSPSEQAES
jgi:hypothetical protein